jgi:excisionase family DNA binding protein
MKESSGIDKKDEPICLTVKDAAELCGLCQNSFRTLVNQRDFPKIKVGRRILIPRQAFIDYINKRS